MSYLGANQPLPPENDPNAVFARVFGDINADPVALARRRKRRQSVLDLVTDEYAALIPKLDAFDRQKLEQHLTALREVEGRLAIDTSAVTDYCVVPSINGLPPHMAPQNYEATGKAQIDLAVAALACDLTRVATLQFSHSVSQHVFNNLGISSAHHDLSHEPDNNPEAQEALIKINTFYAEQYAYLIDKMRSVSEGDGTMLDNSVVVWVNELSKGNSHSRDEVPYVMAGSCGGYFTTGRHVEFVLTPHNDLLLTLMHAMGVEADSFGDRGYSHGPLTRLR